jgi:putative PIN family toxin of toxin-antitoxin system
MLHAVLDANVLVSGLIWKGVPGQIFDALKRRQFYALVSPATFSEFETVISRPKFAPVLAQMSTDAASLVRAYRAFTLWVEPGNVDINAVRDAKDHAVLACAIGGRADVIVTGDQDLLVLEQYAGIPIMTPTAFLDLLGAEPEA